MKKLARRLALAFDKAAWYEVEDDVELCVWVRRQCGRELTLQQAAQLRDQLELLIAKFPMVAVFVRGGVVQFCKSSDPHLRVQVIDFDAIAGDEDPVGAEKMALFEAEDCTHNVFP